VCPEQVRRAAGRGEEGEKKKKEKIDHVRPVYRRLPSGGEERRRKKRKGKKKKGKGRGKMGRE